MKAQQPTTILTTKRFSFYFQGSELFSALPWVLEPSEMLRRCTKLHTSKNCPADFRL